MAESTIAPSPPCAKCGSTSSSIRYCGADGPSRYENDGCAPGALEHFHRTCGRCQFRWITRDVLCAEPKEA